MEKGDILLEAGRKVPSQTKITRFHRQVKNIWKMRSRISDGKLSRVGVAHGSMVAAGRKVYIIYVCVCVCVV